MSDLFYRDFWAEYRAIQASTQKKLLKKPNFNEALKQFNELAAAMEESGMPDQAAYCHKEMAGIHDVLVDRAGANETRHLLKAAHLFHKAMKNRRKMQMNMKNDFIPLMEECYLASIERMLKQNSTRLAGLTFVEMANQFKEVDDFEKSFALLIKASRFLHGDIYAQMTILNNLSDLLPKQRNIKNSLAQLQSTWNSLPKTQIADADPIRLQTEVRILLLHLIHHFPIIPTLPYDGQWRNLYGKSTVANKLEFEIFSRFVTAFRKQDYLEASQIYITELNRLLDEKARKLCSRLLPLLDNSPSNHELDEILESTQMDELQKRAAMFDLMNGMEKRSTLLNLKVIS